MHAQIYIKDTSTICMKSACEVNPFTDHVVSDCMLLHNSVVTLYPFLEHNVDLMYGSISHNLEIGSKHVSQYGLSTECPMSVIINEMRHLSIGL